MYNIIIQYNNDIGYYIYLHNKKKDGKIMDIMPNNSINILSGKEEEINEKIKENARIARLEAKENAYFDSLPPVSSVLDDDYNTEYRKQHKIAANRDQHTYRGLLN